MLILRVSSTSYYGVSLYRNKSENPAIFQLDNTTSRRVSEMNLPTDDRSCSEQSDIVLPDGFTDQIGAEEWLV